MKNKFLAWLVVILAMTGFVLFIVSIFYKFPNEGGEKFASVCLIMSFVIWTLGTYLPKRNKTK